MWGLFTQAYTWAQHVVLDRLAQPALDPDELAVLFRGEPNNSSRRYTLQWIEGQLVFRRSGFDAVFEATLNEMNGKAPDADDYNTVIATDAGPKRFNDGENDSGRSTMGDFMRDFLGRN